MLGIFNKRVLIIIVFLLPAGRLLAQFNTFVSSPSINPSPLQSVESDGTGILRFTNGNSGSEAIVPDPDGVTITITLSNGVPNAGNPLSALGGTASSYYDWEYEGGTYTGTLRTEMEADFSGDITISYRVTANSPQNNPQNGFSISIDPGIFNSGNQASDDATSIYTWTQCDAPNAPQPGAITQPSCENSTGSVVVSGLPGGMWILTVMPGNRTIEGTGTSITVGDLAPGSYTMRVTTAPGCISPPSSSVTINNAPLVPAEPDVRVDCFLGNGFAVITVTSPVNNDFEYRLDNGPYQSSRTFMAIGNGTHTVTVRSSGGCVTQGDPFAVSCGCVNRPGVTLSSTSGSVCGTETVTLNGSFSGSANLVTITENGNGSLSHSQISASPFSFTYTPAASDAGRVVSITVTTNNPLGDPCEPATITYDLTVNEIPSAPLPGNVTQPTCDSSTGSVVLSGLPSSGTWTLTRSPGNVTTQGSGTSATISGIPAGTYTFTVRSGVCISSASTPVVINSQPPTPVRPVAGSIVQPSCTLSTGTINLTALPEDGTWILTRNPGSVTLSGSGETASITGLSAGVYTFTVTNASGCTSQVSNNITINPQPVTPSPPVPGTITQPTCDSPTGRVVMSGLPATGTWTITRSPGDVTTQGNGTSTIISGIPAGTYTFTVSSGVCASAASSQVVINPQPPTPARPVTGMIVQPSCSVSTGTINLTDLPADGAWTLTRNPGSVISSGSGETASITGLPAGVYSFTVTNSSGCTSTRSNNITINPQPVTPAPPIPGEITAPTCPLPLGSVRLSGLPSPGRWTLTSIPAGVNLSGTGTNVSVMDLSPGTYTFVVTNTAGCSSPASGEVIIPQVPDIPSLTIADPLPVCAPATVDLTAPSVTPGLAPDLTLTYWTNPNATNAYSTPTRAGNGTYYIKATSLGECFVIRQVNVTVAPVPVASVGEDQVLSFLFSTNISANVPSPAETGSWSVHMGTGVFQNASSPSTRISELGLGENILIWKVTNNICPDATDTLRITVNDLIVPTLITPNEDGRNDYFILQGIEFMPDNELTIFDRRGVMVFREKGYLNNWNGLDSTGKPLAEDTYFYVLRIGNIKQRSGYIVIRR